MNKVNKLILILISLFSISSVQAKYFSVSENNSKVRWQGQKKVKALGVHHGFIAVKNAKVDLNEKGEIHKAEIVLDMNQITNEDLKGDFNTKLVGHLKSKDFFDVENHKTAKFKSKSVKKLSTHKYELHGDLTIKGKSQPATVIGEYSSNAGKHRLIGEFSFDRTAYGIRFGSGQFFQNLGDKVIADEVQVNFDLITQ